MVWELGSLSNISLPGASETGSQYRSLLGQLWLSETFDLLISYENILITLVFGLLNLIFCLNILICHIEKKKKIFTMEESYLITLAAGETFSRVQDTAKTLLMAAAQLGWRRGEEPLCFPG